MFTTTKILQKIIFLSDNQWINFAAVIYKNNQDCLWIIKYQIFYHQCWLQCAEKYFPYNIYYCFLVTEFQIAVIGCNKVKYLTI